MKTAAEIFLTVGAPIVFIKRTITQANYEGFRAFNKHDIETIQRDAFLAGEESFRLAYRQELEALKELSK